MKTIVLYCVQCPQNTRVDGPAIDDVQRAIQSAGWHVSTLQTRPRGQADGVCPRCRPLTLCPGDRVVVLRTDLRDERRTEAIVIRIVVEIARGGNPGDQVRELSCASWATLANNRKIVVDLDNGHWAYGSQLRAIEHPQIPHIGESA